MNMNESRGDKSFTISFDDIDKAATARLLKYLDNGMTAKVEVDEDKEMGTCIYFDVL